MDRQSDSSRDANDPEPGAALAAIRRLPRYLRFFRDAEAAQQQSLSCTRIAAALNIDREQVHMDLAVAGITSRAGVSFHAAELINTIEHYLGWNNTTDALLIGAGHLGAALAGYAGFQRYGLNIVAVFDVNDHKVGRKVAGKPVRHFDEIVTVAQETHAHMGIITVPGEAAQNVANVLVLAGIRAIWNFAPIHLDVPQNVVVETTDLAASLAILSRKLADSLHPPS